MSDQKEKDYFIQGADYASKPLDYPLDENQKKLAALTMAVNAAMIQLVLEGSFDPREQMHFMSHLAEFADKAFHDEEITFPDAPPMKLNSKLGTMFYEAAEKALKEGRKVHQEVRDAAQKFIQNQPEEQGDPDLSPKRTLN